MDLNELASDLFGSKRAESSTQPSTVSVMYGIATSDSADGLVSVWLSDNALSPTDAQAQWETVDSYDADAYEGMDESTSIEIPTEVTCFKDDVVRVQLTGAGAAKNPTVVGVVGRGDEQNQRLGSIEADYVKATELEADVAQIGFLKADSAVITNLQADTAKVHNLTADQLTAATAYIADLNAANITAQTLSADVAKVHNLTADQLSAAAAYIAALKADSIEATNISAMYGDFDTVKANAAKVSSLTAQQLSAAVGYINDLTSASVTAQNLAADHATIGSLDANYARADLVNAKVAWLQNGLIKDASISDAKIIGVSANKLTAGTIDAAEINVMNLRADNLKVSRVNGQPVIGGYSLVDPSGSGYDSKNPKAQGWYELTANGYVLTNDTEVVSGKAYYTTSTSVELYDQDYIDGLAEDLSDRIDGAIETFTSSAVPTPNNYPASDWTTDDVRATHVGDVCYVLNEDSDSDGWCYRYAYDNTTHQYGWVLIKDSDVTKALYELTDPNGELKTFETQTSTWKTATDNEITSIKSSQTSLETRTGNLETNKVDVSTFNSVSQKVDENSSTISTLSQTVSQKADSSTVTTLSNTVNTVKQTADTNKTSITNLTQTVADNKTAIETRASTIEQDLSGITTRVSATESELDTVSNPNLTPWFSVSVDDTSYWQSLHCRNTSITNSEGLHGIWDREEGWAHITLDGRTSAGNNGSSSCYMNMHVAVGQIQKMVKPSGKYTWMVEVKNLTFVGASSSSALGIRPSVNNATLDVFSNATTSFTEDGTKYAVVTAKASFSSLTMDTRGYCYVPTGCYADFDLRVSLYEGEYAGPYKPFVNQSLANRVKSAETSITQNAEAIALRATKTEAYQLSQPNLSPYFDVPKTDSSYWKRVQTNAHFTTYDMQVEHNGSGAWAHLAGNATSGNPFVRFEPMPLVTIKPSTKYTFTIDIDTVSTASSITSINLQLASGKANSDAFDPFSTSLSFAAKGKTGTYYVIGTTRADISDSMVLSRSYLQVYGTGTFDIYIRLSLYEGEYAGPYKPYVGAKLYASQAELKVANDEISAKVEKDGVISSINQSAESITINANRVNIEGAAIFIGTGRLSSTSLNNAYDAKGAAATVQTNLDNLQVGGRNLVLGTADWSKWLSSSGATISGDEITYSANDTNNRLVGVAVVPGDTYTISMDIRADSAYTYGTTGNTFLLLDYGTSGEYSRVSTEWIFYGTALTTEWQRVSETFTVPSTDTIAQLYVSFRNAGTNPPTYHVRHLKVERGNKATDWTPAPEDQVESAYATCSTAAGTAAKVVAASGMFDLHNGVTITVKFTTANTADAPTLNVNGTGAYPVWNNNAVAASGNPVKWGANATISFVFDGSHWVLAEKAPSYSIACTTSATTRAKAATINGALVVNGTTVAVLFSTANTYVANSVQFNLSSTGAVNIYLDRAATSATHTFTWSANTVITLVRYGAYWYVSDGRAKEAVSVSQRIYYRSTSSTKPDAPTAWVEEATENVYDAWTTKVPPLAASTAEGQTKYLYLWTCEQRKAMSGSFVGCTDVQLDENTTVIDGGNIITHSITAESIQANSLTLGQISTTTQADILNSNVQVGGRNLLLDSEEPRTVSLTSATGTGFYTEYVNESDYGKLLTNGNTTDIFLMSFDWSTTSADGVAWIQIDGNIVTNVVDGNGGTADGSRGKGYLDLSQGSGRYWVSFRYTSTQAGKAQQRIRIRISGAEIPTKPLTAGSTFTASRFKLEKGTKATDWTPAPEDQEDYVNSSVSGISESVSDITAGIDQINDDLTEKSQLLEQLRQGLQEVRNMVDGLESTTSWLSFTEDTGLVIGDYSSSSSFFYTQQTGQAMSFNQMTTAGSNQLMVLSGTNGVQAPKVTANEIVAGQISSDWSITLDGDMFSIDYIGS